LVTSLVNPVGFKRKVNAKADVAVIQALVLYGLFTKAAAESISVIHPTAWVISVDVGMILAILMACVAGVFGILYFQKAKELRLYAIEKKEVEAEKTQAKGPRKGQGRGPKGVPDERQNRFQRRRGSGETSTDADTENEERTLTTTTATTAESSDGTTTTKTTTCTVEYPGGGDKTPVIGKEESEIISAIARAKEPPPPSGPTPRVLVAAIAAPLETIPHPIFLHGGNTDEARRRHYNCRTRDALRPECASRGLPVSGLKVDLVERLLANDRARDAALLQSAPNGTGTNWWNNGLHVH
jgi:hypothetical protein